jgi:hypothetical protein
MKREYTVREWIKDAASEEANRAADIWYDITGLVHDAMVEIEVTHSRDETERIYAELTKLMFHDYQIDKDFVTQLSDNADRIISFLADCKKASD